VRRRSFELWRKRLGVGLSKEIWERPGEKTDHFVLILHLDAIRDSDVRLVRCQSGVKFI
jgi:hypothetical protein